MTGDASGGDRPNHPDQSADDEYSIEDFDDFEPIAELVDDEEPATAEQPSFSFDSADDSSGGPDEPYTEMSEPSQRDEAIAPVTPLVAEASDEIEDDDLVEDGDRVEDGDEVEDAVQVDDDDGDSTSEEPTFGELWADSDDTDSAVEDPAVEDLDDQVAAAFDDVDREQVTEELELVPGEPGDGDDVSDPADSTSEGSGAAAVAGAAAAAAAMTEPGAVFDQDDVRLDEITAERLSATSTQEYAGLAEHVARAASEEQDLIPVAADMPGLERSVVGLEDMVETEGVDDAPAPTRRSSDLPIRIGTAILLLAIFIGALYRPLFLGIVALVVLGFAAFEFYTVLVRSGFHPLTIFGLAGIAAAMVGTWIWGPVAIPMSVAGVLLLTLLFYSLVSGRALPLFNSALTLMVLVWVGLGAFVFDMLESPHYRWLIVALVVTVAVMDIAQYFVGRRLGRTAMAPRISPKKTVEGLAGGVIAALLTGVAFGFFDPFDLGSGLLIGALVALVAPFGDLAVSVVKRAIGVKDMGTVLPGHGGVLDRIDAMLVVVPAAWIAYAWLGLLA